MIGAILGTAVALMSLPAVADSFERPWKNPDAVQAPKPQGLLNSFLPGKTPTAKTARPVVRKTKSAVKKTSKVKVRKTRKRKALAAAHERTINSKEAIWWQSVGNPVVYAFRDCSAKYASGQVASGATTSPAGLITASMKTACQVEFAKMAGVLIGGLGEKKSNAMLIELAKTTFLPTVEAAISVEKEKQRSKQMATAERETAEKSLETAKAAMFSCFSQKTDRLSAAKSTLANTIADSVLIGCQNKSDAFFDLLFANSKASPQVKQQQKNIALNETYRVAIIRRVLATRKNIQIKTATQQ